MRGSIVAVIVTCLSGYSTPVKFYPVKGPLASTADVIIGHYCATTYGDIRGCVIQLLENRVFLGHHAPM
jgi:hypothetical protein